MQFINDRMKTMGKKIKDLDDVKFAMLCLEMIREEFIGYDDVLNYGCFEISNETAKVILVNRKITEWTWSWILLKRATQLFINSILIFQKTMRTWCTVYVMLSKICFWRYIFSILKLLKYLTLDCLIWFWCLRWCSHNKCNRRSSICKVPCRKSWPRVCQRSTLMCSSLMLITMRLVPWHLDYPPERLQTGKKVHRYSFKFLTLYCITNMYKLSNHLTVLPHGV